MSMLTTRLLIAAILAAIVIVLLIAYRSRIKTAWRGHLAGVINFLVVGAVVLVANGLLRTYVF